MKSIIIRFEISVRFGFTQCRSNFSWKDFKELVKEPRPPEWIRFLQNFFDGALVIAIHLPNINLSIKRDTFPSQFADSNLCLRKELKHKKNYRHIPVLPLISKVIEKSIHDQTQDYLQKNEIKRFHSYLTNTAFFVSLGIVSSEAGTINYGVSQGFILGPLLFCYTWYSAGSDRYSYIPVYRRHKCLLLT